MIMKRQILNFILDGSGITGWRWSRPRAGLYCFNFHRVGNDDGSAFHPNLFSCSGGRFSEIIALLKKTFTVVGLDRVLEWIESGEAPDHAYALITFDDGYIDNYNVAFKALKGLDCPALFFLPTDFIGSGKVPWWDQIAWCVHEAGDRSIDVPGGGRPVRLDSSDLEGSIRRTLRVVKDTPNVPVDVKVRAIIEQVRCIPIGDTGQQLFLDWDQAREMREAGMWIGSHSATHQVLSHLDSVGQERELRLSKEMLERELGEPIDSVAYPVGGYNAYTEETKRLVGLCGYRAAFNFVSGINRSPAERRFDILRMPVENEMSLEDLRRMTAFAKVY